MISTAIDYIIGTTAAITDIVGDNYFNTISEQDSEPPAIIYRSRTEPDYVKSGTTYDMSTTEVLLLSEDKEQLDALWQAFRAAFENKRGTFAGIIIEAARVDYFDERYMLETDTFYIISEWTFKHK